MVEQKLEVTSTNKSGKVYKNLCLKASVKKGTPGLDPENYAIVEKTYAEGKEFKSPILQDYAGNPVISYACQVKYNGEECSFWLNAKEHEAYKVCGGVGDKVRIDMKEEKIVNKKTGAKMLVNRLSFSKVD